MCKTNQSSLFPYSHHCKSKCTYCLHPYTFHAHKDSGNNHWCLKHWYLVMFIFCENILYSGNTNICFSTHRFSIILLIPSFTLAGLHNWIFVIFNGTSAWKSNKDNKYVSFALSLKVTVPLPMQFCPNQAAVQWHVYPSNSSTHVAPFAQGMDSHSFTSKDQDRNTHEIDIDWTM